MEKKTTIQTNTVSNEEGLACYNKSRFLQFLDKMPHPLALLTCFALAGMVLTWIIPAGEYTRIVNPTNNANMVVAGSFHYLPDSNPQGILDFLFSFWNGMFASNSFTVYMLMIGGAISAISATGAIDALVYKAHKFAESRPGLDKLIVSFFIVFFGFCGSTFGMSAETLIFLPILVALCRTLKYDAVVAVALSIASCNLGYACGTTNAFNIGLAQGIAELPLMSGIEFRFVWAVISFAVSIWYVLRYCKKIQADPTTSLVCDVDYSDYSSMNLNDVPQMTLARILSLLTLLLAIAGVVYGAIFLEFGFKQLSTLFLSAAFISGIISRMSISHFAEQFAKGAATMVVPLMLLGVARSFLILMQDGLIMDTIINFLAQPLDMLPRSLTVGAMVIFQGILNIFIPAASGQAAVSMPIMIPLADLLEINRQVAVFAFQVGDGFGNVIIPTFGPLMAALAIARVPYGRWFAFAAPLVLIQYGLGIIAAIIANAIDYGPF